MGGNFVSDERNACMEWKFGFIVEDSAQNCSFEPHHFETHFETHEEELVRHSSSRISGFRLKFSSSYMASHQSS